MLDNYPDVLSFRQVMEITHVGRNLLLRLLNSGEIPASSIIRKNSGLFCACVPVIPWST